MATSTWALPYAAGATGPTGAPGAAGATGPTGAGVAWQGAWSSGTTYAQNGAVRGTNSSAYLSLVDSNSGHDPVSDANVPITDNFNRANGALDDNVLWSLLDPFATLTLQIDTNQVKSSDSAGQGMSYWLGSTYTDFENEVTIPVLPSPTGSVFVLGRIVDAGSEDPEWSGYEFGLSITGFAGPGVANFDLDRVTTGNSHSLAGTTFGRGGPYPVTAGDRIKLRIVGDRLEGWHYSQFEGAWKLRCFAVDATYANAGPVGIEIQGSSITRLSNFGVRAYSALNWIQMVERGARGTTGSTGP